ncbi:MAG: hypothetical protein PHO10_05960 [Gemmiger sp.]|nr:hypothetical protein [Gemmiger sp.]
MMKTCVATATFSCDPNKVWLYMVNPVMNHWRKDVAELEPTGDEMRLIEKNTDGTTTKVVFSRKEKPRHITCTFEKGKIKGSFTAVLLGGGDSTSVECTLEADGLSIFTKSKKLLDGYLGMLRQALGE